MASNEGWAWKRDAGGPLILWVEEGAYHGTATLFVEHAPSVDTASARRMFGPGHWILFRLVEVVDDE